MGPMNHVLSTTTMLLGCVVLLCVVTAPCASFGDSLPATIRDFRELDDPSVTPYDQFGSSIDAHQSKIIVGAWQGGGGNAYIYDADSGSELHRLRGNDTRGNDLFGRSVSMNDQYALVGANQAQAAYVFSVETGQQLWKLPDPDAPPTFGFGFGLSTAVSGNIGVVGDLGDDERGTDAGAAYIYDLSSGQLRKKLLAPGPSPLLDKFGSSVALEEDYLLVGAPSARGNSSSSGAVYVYDSAGTFQRELVAFDSEVDAFGREIAVSGNLALIGAPRYGRSGAAYLFNIDTGDLLRKFLPPDLSAANGFGGSVAFDGRHALIGDPESVFDGRSYVGSAFYYDAISGNLLATLTPEENPSSLDFFGRDVDIERNNLFVGSGRDLGRVYIATIPEPSTSILLFCSLLLCSTRRIRIVDF